MLRPGIIQPLHGIQSKTRSYRVFYSLCAFLLPLLRALFPEHVLTTTQIGTAMLNLAKHGYAKRILESRDILAVANAVDAADARPPSGERLKLKREALCYAPACMNILLVEDSDEVSCITIEYLHELGHQVVAVAAAEMAVVGSRTRSSIRS